MNNKKPAIYHNEINKNINNCRSVFSTLYNKKTKEIEDTFTSYDHFNLMQKIYNIFRSPNFIYKADVNIVTNNDILKKRIVGKIDDYLITIDNERIPINIIKDIYIKKDS